MEVTVDGLKYHVQVKGSGPTLLLLHGFTGSIHTWDPWITDWATRFQVVRVDLPGHGKTATPKDPSRIEMVQVCRDLAGILDRIGVERASVLGYSLGGRTALSFALTYPERVRALVLESASPGLEQAEERQERVVRDEALARRIEAEGVVAFVRRWEEIPLFASQKRLPVAVREQIRGERLNQTAAGLAASLRGMGTGAQPSWWGKLESLTRPVLLITGEEDEKFCRIAKRIKTKLPGARLQMVDGAGHAVHVEQPRRFGTIVADFILDFQGC
ncbi:2-succinyl-6-hydroxy-2,4-cyclohexadiene-1-carboxylate synthase [Desmospora activa]|uniref:Putative 2-succinyl-6-hydroxy-2,4-cyclohexadiene-1-carboxylate synthase n=1 Tax=Desmospora activa DSM 45169 TaxID=1121389 RepID=A0A2T4Z7H9_9BACL|nr:2-succinyl-6-hydroxy-2,4-cyclohexadiene-1-carboxylate synthase [Desmospora activa]PTM57833.1 2-succinyl-6-hydroxy-2,4-cyclohexadiene-1-carboxylate synthase [Desmospora activa DSM 45169]